MKITTVLIGLAAMAVSLPATTIYFGGGGSLGSSHVYGPVTAKGYLSNGNLGTLYGKGAVNGTGSEDGLGLTADPTGDNEIFPGTDFIQLSGVSLLTGPIYISMGSTGGDAWAVYGTNTAGSLASAILLASGSNDDGVEVSVPNALNYLYLDIKATSNNVLLQDLKYTSAATTTPEPSTLGVVGLGGVLIGLLRRTRHQN